jgi:hypothetical protein
MSDRQNVKLKIEQAIYTSMHGLPICGLQVICNGEQESHNKKCVFVKNIYLWQIFQS